jgi:rubrerythrin
MARKHPDEGRRWRIDVCQTGRTQVAISTLRTKFLHDAENEMSLLRNEPAGTVESIEELMALAAAMEDEAATRYAEIAERMRHEGDPALADVFDRLSAGERHHLESVHDWSRRTNGKGVDPATIRWNASETFDDEGSATAHPRLFNAYRALSMAVRNEERAFAFWSYVAAHAKTDDVRQAAETMAHEELGHVAILRRERRQAFHTERRRTGGGDGESATDLADLERHLADLLEPLTHQSPEPERTRLTDFIEGARRNARELDRASVPLKGVGAGERLPEDPVVLAELLAERYLEVGDLAGDEATLDRMQSLAGDAISRLAWLRDDLPELHG